MLHGYCIRTAADPPPPGDLLGLDDAPVRAVLAAGLQIWVSDAEPARATVERLRRHDHVVATALRSATPLPLRFGSRFRDPEDAARVLEARREEFESILRRVAGRVEMGVRVTPAHSDHLAGVHSTREETEPADSDPADAPGRSPGLAYLRRRRTEVEREQASRERLERHLSAIEVGMSELRLPSAPPILTTGESATLAHLVPTTEVGVYRDHVARLGRAHPDVRLTVSGPWAPYSFVSPDDS